jgi:SH3-like domain-containing protein
MRILALLLLSFAILCPPVLAKSGLPVPRFVSLRSPHINVRVGPGKDYPIEWVYVRANLPVEIIAEFENWRKIKDIEGSEGWVHQSMLSGTRHALIQKQIHDVKDKPAIDSRVLAQIEPDVMVRVQKCQGEWCRIQHDTIKGWLPKDSLWGVYTNETIN